MEIKKDHLKNSNLFLKDDVLVVSFKKRHLKTFDWLMELPNLNRKCLLFRKGWKGVG